MMRNIFALLILCVLSNGHAQSVRTQSPVLPQGDGKALVEIACFGCHGSANIFYSKGYDTAEEWKYVFSSMIKLPTEQENRIAHYLAEHFPDKNGRQPVLISGNSDITITEWLAPTLGQRARDPIEAPDGSIWWAGMWASLAGRLDPSSGSMSEFKLPTTARPHSIVPDKKGNIWYTGNSNGTIGKLNPKTGLITEFKTKAGDPHSAVFHPNGNLYFTAQRAGALGRLDPITGKLTEVLSEPRPYGIKVDDSGILWIAFNGTNKIGSMDPITMKLRYYNIPNKASRIRRLDIDSKGLVWFVNSTQGKIGRLNPKTGDVRQWDSPSGSKSHPYALAVINDKIWYNESGMRPDALVQFDPSKETFQSWAIPSGVGIIRNMWVTKDGDLLIHQTSSNRIGLVEIN
jgi:virginiamycin B lyase|tara:strand:+ start:153 stop:1358 length:1206 start_codon:yes stop_codon:yes gene_type:complete